MTTTTTRKPAAAKAVQTPAGTDMLRYMSGFANEFATEAHVGALPVGQNSPQQCSYGLYAEQLSGTAFTAPRHANRRSWLYRIRPAAVHRPFARADNGRLLSDFGAVATPPNQLRWDPLPIPATPTDFVQGIVTMAGNGDPYAQAGCGIHLYAANRSMTDRAFYNADGEMLIVPQQGRLRFATELGIIDAEPHEIVVIPRGVRFRVELIDDTARGYVCENFGAAFRLPDLGVIGSNGLANPRDFATPVGVVRGPRRQIRVGREIHGQPMDRGNGPFAVRCRCLARQLCAIQVRSAPVQRHRLDQLRSPRSVDLSGAAGANRNARR